MDRKDFISQVSASLGRDAIPEQVVFDSRYDDLGEATLAAGDVRNAARAKSAELLAEAIDSLETGGWNVHRASTVEDVGDIVSGICEASGITSAVKTDHLILEHSRVDDALERSGVECSTTRLETNGAVDEKADQVEAAKQHMFEVDAGITGGDYVIAETGTLVIHPGAGVARLASLAPPIHVAVVHVNQVLPSLDELFLLEHVDLLSGQRASGMNLISGPSRTGDIEATIVHGIHGPIETHIVLVG